MHEYTITMLKKWIIFAFISIVLLAGLVVNNCDFCVFGGSTIGAIFRIPLYLQIVSLVIFCIALFAVIFHGSQTAWIKRYSLLLLSFIPYYLSSHIVIDNIVQERMEDTWIAYSNHIKSSPADTVFSCNYDYPYLHIIDDLGNTMDIFIGIYPFKLDERQILKRCKNHA